MHFKRKSRQWRLIHNPFPAKLHPGSCLPVVIQYRATEKCSRACELVIESDDRRRPLRFLMYSLTPFGTTAARNMARRVATSATMNLVASRAIPVAVRTTKTRSTRADADRFSKKHLWLGAESNRRHVDFQSTALPTELPSLSIR
jgi:hypothetical protein